MSFKPEIEKILNDIVGPKSCICSSIKEGSRDTGWGSVLMCPGCSVRDTLVYAIIGYLTGKINREGLIKVFEYTSNAHPLKVAAIFDRIYSLKEQADQISYKDLDDEIDWNLKWGKVFGTDNKDDKDDKDDKGN